MTQEKRTALVLPKLQRIPRDFMAALGFVGYCAKRFGADNCPRIAASLSYSSLLAIVPMLALGLGLLSAFPAFKRISEDLQALLFENLMPEVGLEISDYISGFVANASQMTGIGVLALAVTALLLLSTITSAFNAIWRVSEPRSFAVRMMVYWAVLTLGPLMVGASLSLSSYGFAMVEFAGMEGYTRSFGLTRLLPLALAAAGFTTLYLVVPARSVRMSHALLGGVVAAVLFEALKRAFGAYLQHFPSYQAIYGALAAVPIFLLWMYLSWSVVLIGAEIAAALPEWRAARRVNSGGGSPGSKLALALSILSRLRQAARDGKVLKETVLARGLPANLEDLGDVLSALRASRFATRAGSRWVLSRDLAAVDLKELLVALNLTLEIDAPWPDSVKKVVADLAGSGEELTGRSVGDLLDEASALKSVPLERRA